jgi:Ca2+-binding EF-hand superfamily protein
MGNAVSGPQLTKEQVEEYVDLTLFNARQIRRAWKRFHDMNTDRGDQLSRDELTRMPELAVNPLRERIAMTFSSDGSGGLTFDDFLDLLTAFSPMASVDVKSSYAFRIYDMDGDGYLGEDDIRKLLRLLLGHRYKETEATHVVNQIMKECDLDGDEKISFIEFDYVVRRSPDFVNYFQIQL